MSVEQTQGPRIIVALDYAEPKQAMAMAEGLDPRHCRVKVGKELCTRGGPQWVRQLVGRGFDVFLDLKFHDIPHTVAQAVKAAADLGAGMVSVHASGGSAMLRAALAALNGVTPRPLLIGVTVLTSMNESDLHEIGFSGSIEEQVARLAGLTQRAGRARCARVSVRTSSSSRRAYVRTAPRRMISNAASHRSRPSAPAPTISSSAGPSRRPPIPWRRSPRSRTKSIASPLSESSHALTDDASLFDGGWSAADREEINRQLSPRDFQINKHGRRLGCSSSNVYVRPHCGVMPASPPRRRRY